MSYILIKTPGPEGLLYAGGTFWAVQLIWNRANRRPAQFVTEDDLFHRGLQICTLVLLGTIVLHIRPVKIMSNPSEEISMFVFSLCLVLEDILEMVKCLDEYFFGVGQRVAIKASARFGMVNTVFTLLSHIPALVLAALEFFPRSSDYSRRLAAEYDTPGEEGSDYKEEDGSYSKYGDGDETSTTNVPILLILASGWMLLIFLAIRVIFFFPKNGKHKEKYVFYCIHVCSRA